MNKGYASGFLLVLLVLVLGFYVAYTGFVSSRETLRAQPTSVSSTRVAQAQASPTAPELVVPTTPVLTPVRTRSVDSAPVITFTLTAPPVPHGTKPPPPTSPPAPKPTEPNPVQPAGTPTPEVQPPTPVPAPAHLFRLGGPPMADPDYAICCYIYGSVRDAAGNGLEGVHVQASNEWTAPIQAITKGGGEIGKYDIPINATVVNWEIVLVDAAGNRISSKVPVQFDANAAKGFRVDWQRTY